MTQLYDIVRFFADRETPYEVREKGLTLAQAQKHCGLESTHESGVWFDGYSKTGTY